MFAAITAAQNGAKVLLLDKNDRLGKKLLITGKGRCNVTNNCSAQEVLQNTPRNGRFLYSAMTAYPEMVAGSERICTQLMSNFGDRLFCKSGASAFYAVGLKGKGIGIALKMEDGASSIVPYAILEVLRVLGVISREEAESVPGFRDRKIYNNHHAEVGRTELVFRLEPGESDRAG